MPLTPAANFSTTPVSPYFTWQTFVNRYGYDNIRKVSNKDATQSSGSGVQSTPATEPNWYAVQDAFNYATDEINAALRGGVLKVPLDFTPNANVVPSRVGRWAMVIAYCDLYDMRITQDQNKARHAPTKMEKMLSDVYAMLSGYRGGQPGFQMYEAVHAAGADPQTPTIWDVYAVGAAVRYVDGAWQFWWGSTSPTPF